MRPSGQPSMQRPRLAASEGLDLNLVAGLITSAVSGVQMAWLEDPDFDMAAHLAQLMDLIRAKPDDS